MEQRLCVMCSNDWNNVDWHNDFFRFFSGLVKTMQDFYFVTICNKKRKNIFRDILCRGAGWPPDASHPFNNTRLNL